MRTDAGWHDVTIGNASSRGMLLEVPCALDRRTFVEVRHREQVIVARVMWSDGVRCGVRTQDLIDIAGLRSRSPPPARRPGEERRSARRPLDVAPRRAETDPDASRQLGRVFDFAAISLCVVAVALGLANASGDVLASTLAEVSIALEGSAER